MTAFLSRRMLAAVAAGVLLAGVAISPARADQPNVTGTVTDLATGEPIPGACVTLISEAGAEVAQSCVGDDGVYSLAAPAMGLYKIRATADTYHDLWAANELDAESAGAYLMGPGGFPTFPIAFKLFHETATLTGQITDPTGAPVENAEARVGLSRFAYSDADGRYTISGVIPGQYVVRFSGGKFGVVYAPSSETPEGGTIFDLTDGSTVVADGQFLPLGTAEITVVEAATGTPVTDTCVGGTVLLEGPVCNAPDGVYRIPDLRPGSWSFYLGGGTHLPVTVDVSVVREQTTRITVALTRAEAIVTRVIDRWTHQPVSACAILMIPGARGLNANQPRYCSGSNGHLVIPLHGRPGTYKLFMEPQTDEYGAQWVSLFGGTGNQELAWPITVGAGANVTIPSIRMDRAGSISGIARKADGTPAANVCALPYAPEALGLWRETPACTDADGRYTITGLGPYHWPVLFMGESWVWSGNKSNRYIATKVHVKAGRTATMNAVVPVGATISGNVRNTAGNPVSNASIYAYNAVTGDYATGVSGAPFGQPYQLRGLAPQHIRIQYNVTSSGGGGICWYESTTDPAQAKRIRVQSGAAMTLDLTGCG